MHRFDRINLILHGFDLDLSMYYVFINNHRVRFLLFSRVISVFKDCQSGYVSDMAADMAHAHVCHHVVVCVHTMQHTCGARMTWNQCTSLALSALNGLIVI